MPAQARLSWEAAVFGACTVWWIGRYANPPVVEACFCETQGVLSGRKRVPERQEVRFEPVAWLFLARGLLPCPVPTQSGLKSSRDEASVLRGTLIRGQILPRMPRVLPGGMGGRWAHLLRSPSALFFPPARCSSVGRVAETKKRLLNPKGGRSRKGTGLFPLLPGQAG